MKRSKRVLSFVLAVLMAASYCTAFSFAATPSLEDFAIALDDTSVSAVNTGDNTFTVKLPDGRPRVPQVSAAAGAEVTQAFLPDDSDRATATVVSDGQTVKIEFVKDKNEGFVLQYDDYYTFDPGFSGASFVSDNPSVVEVSNKGEIHVLKVSDKAVNITATAGAQIKTLTITKTIKAVLAVWMLTGQSNSAINYFDKNTAIVPKKGTTLYYGWQFNGTSDSINYALPANLIPMTAANGTLNVASNEPALASTLYSKTGEKILMLNGGISGTGISYFLPGCGTDTKTYTWAHTNEVYEQAYALWNSKTYLENYETRVRSYFFLQGCAEVGSEWTVHYNGFAVNKNVNSFKTLGKTYAAGTHTWRTYMSDILGFDYCFDILIAWRPVGIVTSTRTAQLKLAEDFDDYFIASRINQTFSLDEGTYRYDNLHYSQIGKNYLGQSAAAKAAAVYQKAECLEPAKSADAYFNKIGYKDGETFYVSPGDFYNYCTRGYPYTTDDPFTYKFVGDNIVEFDGVNNFSIKTDAKPGASCQMEIYSYADSTKPLTTVTIQVAGDGAENFSTRGTKEYSWSFDADGKPTTTTGNIDLKDAGFGTGALEMSRDLVLDNTKYWAIEWEANGTASGSMLASSSNTAAQANGSGGKPDFVFIYYYNTTGWRIFRDTVYTDYFWQTHTGSDVTGKHTYKLECSGSLYKFSIDGKVIDTRELIEGHASYKDGSSYSGAGKFSDFWNIHYLLGGINQNGLSSTKYGYKGDVSYIKITTNESERKITNINGFPYAAVSGKGTKDAPYVINARVAEGTVINAASFTASTPAGTLLLSEETFGGKALDSFTCTAGGKTVYAMLTGSIASNSIFYKINFSTSSTPDRLPDNMYPDSNAVMVDVGKEAMAAAAGATLVRNVKGKTYNFVKGYNLYTDLDEAMDALGEDGTLFMMPGTYAQDVTLDKNITVIGPKAGVNPNRKGTLETDAWTLSDDRSNVAEEAVITGKWSLRTGCQKLTVDGISITLKGGFKDDATTDETPIDVTFDNVMIHDISAADALSFGEGNNRQSGARVGKLTLNHVCAYNNSRRLMLTALDDQSYNDCYFSGTNIIDFYRVPGVKDGNTDHTASYTVNGCYFDSINYRNFLTLAIAPNYSGSAAAYENIAFNITGNVFRNCIDSSTSTACGAVYLIADKDNFTMNVQQNTVYEDDASASEATKSFLYAVSYAANTGVDFARCYAIKNNRFISTAKDLPYVFSTNTTAYKSHNNICISGNYFEVAGALANATVNSISNSYTGGHIVSYSEYRFVQKDMTATDCMHPRTHVVKKAATCQEAGFEGTECLVCGEGLLGTEIPKIDHVGGDWTVISEPTCTEDGEEEQRCLMCKTLMSTRTKSKLGHDDGQWITMIEASCTQAGLESRYCTRDHALLETREIEKKPHNYTAEQTKAPSCSAEGEMTYTCTECKTFYTVPIKKTAHTPGAWEVTQKATCKQAGEEARRCLVCKEIMITREIEQLSHTPGAWVILKKATYTQSGLKQRSCLLCGDVLDTQEIPMLTTSVTDVFEDLGLRDWYVKNGAIDFVYRNKLFDGVSKTEFAPNENMTRAMFVTVLGRMAGVSVSKNVKTKFSDVKSGQWYTGYIKWASDNGIVNGDNGKFMPDDNVTREQICKMMVTYCSFAGIKLKTDHKEVIFKDQAKISGWAKEYVKKCQMAGLVNGSGGYFRPQGYATRAEVATIIMNFKKNY